MLKIGFAGFRHAHIFSLYRAAAEHPGVEIAGAWEEFAAAKEFAAGHHGVEFTHETYAAMLGDPHIDAVAIGNYYGARGRMAIDALKAGKHVIADKPLCTSRAQLGEIERLAREKNLKIGLMLDLRYHENAAAARKLIEDGEIGAVNCVYFGGQHPLNYGARPGWYFEPGKHGGTINDIAVHGVDLIRYMTGLGVSKVESARCWNGFAAQEKDFADCAQFMAALENGAGLIADVSYALPDSFGFDMPCYWAFQIWGTGGMLTFTVSSDGVTLYQNGDRQPRILPGIKPRSDCLADFIADIKGDAAGTLNTPEVIRSSRETLDIQAAADDNAKKTLCADSLKVKIYDTRREMGRHCGILAAEKIRALLAAHDEINIIFAAAPSQNEVLATLLSEEGIDWRRVNAFHMDEYIGLSPDAPQGFGNFLREKLFDRLPFKSVNYLDGNAPDIDAECERYAALLSGRVHLVCLGIGENGHIAFNDPGEADFNDERLVKRVTLDEKCRRQQVNDGCFKALAEVPKYALTLTIPALMKGENLFCAVPAATKAEAVRGTVLGEVSEFCPASILRTHPGATLFCDADSGKYLL